MNEEHWLTCMDSDYLFKYLWSKPDVYTERKLRLFICACCRSVWHKLTDQRNKKAVRVAERYADGKASASLLTSAWIGANQSATDLKSPFYQAPWLGFYASEVRLQEMESAFLAALSTSRNNSVITYDHRQDDEFRQANILRDIMGNPFQTWFETESQPGSQPSYREFPPGHITDAHVFYKAWRTPTVLSLAQATYRKRNVSSGLLDNTRLAILADALEDSSCDNSLLLDSLRDNNWQLHYRGYWVLDLILGKT